jgi:hypothetical protein
LDCLPLTTRATLSFWTLGTTHPTTWHHIPEDLNPQPQCSENLNLNLMVSQQPTYIAE